MMRWQDQRGSATTVFVLAWSVILITVAFAADFGRIFFIREQLRTALDAASLGGALQLDYKVEMAFTQWRYHEWRNPVCEEPPPYDPSDPPPDPDAPLPPPWEPKPAKPLPKQSVSNTCWHLWWAAAPQRVVFTGWEDDVWKGFEARWNQQCEGSDRWCDLTEELNRACWIEPAASDDHVEQVAGQAFGRNQVWGNQATLKQMLVTVERGQFAGGNPSRPRQVIVRANGELHMKTYLLAMLGAQYRQLPVEAEVQAELARRGVDRMVSIDGKTLTSPCDLHGSN